MTHVPDQWAAYRPNTAGRVSRVEEIPPQELDGHFVGALRRLIAAGVTHASDNELRAAIASVCTLARREGVTIERILILFHAEWAAADKSTTWQTDELEHLRGKLASECINQFYDSHE